MEEAQVHPGSRNQSSWILHFHDALLPCFFLKVSDYRELCLIDILSSTMIDDQNFKTVRAPSHTLTFSGREGLYVKQVLGIQQSRDGRTSTKHDNPNSQTN